MFLLMIGIVLCADSLVFSIRTNGNLGIWLPGIFGLPLVLLALFYEKLLPFFNTGAGAFCKWFLICAYALSILFFSLTSLFLYSQGHKKAPANADALIVLGCAVYGERPSLTLTRRLDAAIAYLEENPETLCFVSGGQGNGEDIPEAEAMKTYLISRGIASERVVAETKSMSTTENFAFTYPLIEERFGSGTKIVYVSTYFHVYRAGRVASAQGIEAYGCGARGVWYITLNDYLRECVAVFAYKLLNAI